MDKDILDDNRLNPEIDEGLNEVLPSRKSHKKAIIAGIIGGIILITATTFIIGCTKFNWFSKDEIYNLNIELKSVQNQIQYFTDNKEIKTITGYSNGKIMENVQNVDTDFMVAITDKKDSKNTAIMVVLQSKIRMEGQEETINQFNIFDEETVKEFESNPDATKYQIAKFTYDDKGSIIDVLLPKNMDRYNAQIIMGIIEGVIPKLTRNRTEDNFSGLSIEVSELKGEAGISEIETQSNQVYVDKYTKKEYTGSNYNSKVERVIQNQMVKSINSQVNLYIKNDADENENNYNIGFDSFDIQINSIITLTKSEEENKESTQLITKLADNYEYMKSKDLIDSLLQKEEENNQPDEDEEESTSLRELGGIKWEGSFAHEKELFSFSILKKKVSFVYSISLSDGKIKNVLYVKCGDKKFEIGNKGFNLPKKQTKTKAAEVTLLTFPFPALPFLVNIQFIVGGEFDWEILVKVDQSFFQELKVTLGAAVYGKAQANVGVKHAAQVSVGVRGDLVKADGTSSISKADKKYSVKTSVTFKTARVEIYAKAKLLWKTIFNKSLQVFKGIGVKTITF